MRLPTSKTPSIYATPGLEKWAMPREERVAMALQAYRDLARLSREEDAFIRAGRPASGSCIDDIRKLIHDRYEEMIANCRMGIHTPPRFARVEQPAPVDYTPPPVRKRRPAPPFVPV